MNTPNALRYLYGLQRFGIKFGLSNTRRILQALGNPHLNLKVIHIAGTNGKGSTAAMITSILSAAGFRAGLYTSPHFIHLSERIQINGRLISEGDLIKEAREIRKLITRIDFTDSYPTYFEALTCIAFSYFNKKGVDYAVMETGMGGRLDATNVCLPVITVITDISLDHQIYLGGTLEEIAAEKAGIIKPGCPLVCGVTKKEILELLMEECKSKGVPVYLISSLYNLEELYLKTKKLHKSESFYKSRNLFEMQIRREGRPYLTVRTSLKGRFQIQNTLLAIEAIERLKESGIMIKNQAIKDGLRKTVWPGRLQVISQKPYLILDGAHNPSAAQSLADTIQIQFNYKELLLIIGILKDKDIAGICNALFPLAGRIIITAPKFDRAASPKQIYDIIQKDYITKGKEIITIPCIPEAIKKAKEMADTDDLILVTGSLYVVGEAMSNLGIEPYPKEAIIYQ